MNPWLAFVLGVVTGLALVAPIGIVWFRAAVSTPEQAVSAMGVLLRSCAKAVPDLSIVVEIEGQRGRLPLVAIADAVESSCIHSDEVPLDPSVTGRVFRGVEPEPEGLRYQVSAPDPSPESGVPDAFRGGRGADPRAPSPPAGHVGEECVQHDLRSSQEGR